MPTCKLCLSEVDKLCNSHIIPKSFFRRMKQGTNDGLLVKISNGDKKNQLSGREPSEELLCQECEHLLSERYEKPSIELLRGKGGVHKTPKKVILHKVNYQTLMLFWYSILWRASVSTKDEFSSVTFDASGFGIIGESLRQSIYKGVLNPGDEIFKVRISRIVSQFSNFSGDKIKAVIIPPKKAKDEHGRVYFEMVVEGFHIEMFPNVGRSYCTQRGMLDRRGVGVFTIPTKMITDVRPIMQGLKAGMDNEDSGRGVNEKIRQKSGSRQNVLD